jgi:hypothetical protein
MAASRSASCISMTSCARAWRKSGLVSRASAARAGALSLRSDLLSRPSRASALARAEREPGPSAKSSEARHRGAIRRAAPGSRVSLRSPGTRERGPRACAPISCPGRAERARLRERSESRDPAQRAAKRDTGGRSVVRPLGPGSRCARPGHGSGARVSFRGIEQSALLVPAARSCARVGLYPFASIPKEGWAERRQAHISVVARARRDGPRW